MSRVSCTICTRDFKSQNALNAHMQVHKPGFRSGGTAILFTRANHRHRLHVEKLIRRKSSDGRAVADVPAAVRKLLGAQIGDWLIFDEGCDAAVQKAALLGTYVVVRVEAPNPEPTWAPAVVAAQSSTESSELESFASIVRRKLGRVHIGEQAQ